MVLSTETFNQSVRTKYSEAVNARYTFQPLWVSDLTELTGQTGHLEGITLQHIQINTLRRSYILLQKNTREYHASVPSNGCIFFAK